MHVPPTAEILAAWERGLYQPTLERGLTLLALTAVGERTPNLASLSIGERDRRLLSLRAAIFGLRMEAIVACDACGAPLEIDLDAAALASGAPHASASVTLSCDGYTVSFRQPDSADLIAAAKADAAEARDVLLHRCLISAFIDGEPLSAERLPVSLVREASERLTDADPHADVRFALACPFCNHRWRAPFDIVPFLWTELDAWALRLLDEVHTLAYAYGWTESEILGLSELRRRHYLQMVEA